MLQPSVVLAVSATWSGSAETSGEPRPHLLPQLHHLASKYGMPLRPSAASRSSAARTASSTCARHRSERPGVEVRDPLEHGKLGPRLLEGHPASRSTGAWPDSTTAILHDGARRCRTTLRPDGHQRACLG